MLRLYQKKKKKLKRAFRPTSETNYSKQFSFSDNFVKKLKNRSKAQTVPENSNCKNETIKKCNSLSKHSSIYKLNFYEIFTSWQQIDGMRQSYVVIVVNPKKIQKTKNYSLRLVIFKRKEKGNGCGSIENFCAPQKIKTRSIYCYLLPQ